MIFTNAILTRIAITVRVLRVLVVGITLPIIGSTGL